MDHFMKSPLPPGIDAATFSQALAAFAQVVGDQWVFTREADLQLYRDPYSPLRDQPDELLASAAVAPQSTAEVQEVVRIANRYRVPLYPISTGKNLGYGGPAPSSSGSVVLDLKRMTRILAVDEATASALVEPGVSYFDLYRYIQERGLKVWIDCPDPGWGSVLGNAIDRGGGYTMAQYRNHFDAHCGMEIVLPDGELLRTGMGAVPNATTWQQYKSGCGPWIDGLFSQANYGIVTKMGFWLMPQPEAYLRGSVAAYRYSDLGPLVEALNYLENSQIMTGFPDLASPVLGIAPGGSEHLFNEIGPLPVDEAQQALIDAAELGYSKKLEEFSKIRRVPYWEFWLSFHGPMEVIDAQWAAAQRILRAKIPETTFQVIDRVSLPIPPEKSIHYHEPELGVPSLRNFSVTARSRWNPTGFNGHMWFSPIVPRSGEAIIEGNRVFSQAAREFDMPLFRRFALPTGQWQRAFMFILATPVTDDPATNKRYVEGFRKLITVGGQHGWGEYRTTPFFQKAVMDVFSFNNHALPRFHELLKDAIDPNGIIAPGRYNIWPKHMRGAI
jgi:(+)-pinoresinol hydroxylase